MAGLTGTLRCHLQRGQRAVQLARALRMTCRSRLSALDAHDACLGADPIAIHLSEAVGDQDAIGLECASRYRQRFLGLGLVVHRIGPGPAARVHGHLVFAGPCLAHLQREAVAYRPVEGEIGLAIAIERGTLPKVVARRVMQRRNRLWRQHCAHRLALPLAVQQCPVDDAVGRAEAAAAVPEVTHGRARRRAHEVIALWCWRAAAIDERECRDCCAGHDPLEAADGAQLPSPDVIWEPSAAARSIDVERAHCVAIRPRPRGLPRMFGSGDPAL